MTTVLFAQLPPPRFDFSDPGANIPLAAGFLISSLRSRSIELYDTEILSDDVVDIFGDSGLIRKISDRSPDILALTLYVWNSQRSLFVASCVKRILPGLKIIIGGPEANLDNEWILNHPAIDLAVIGEGEPQFLDALQYLVSKNEVSERSKSPGKRKPDIFEPKSADKNTQWRLGCSAYPYLNGVMSSSRNGTVFLETARGCPFKCRYCYYHKAFDSVELYPMPMVERVLDFCYSDQSNVNEIYLMDPTFNARPGFRRMLKYIIKKRVTRDVKIHAELRADLLDEDDMALFREAGLISAEIGLQTVNLNALKLAGRSGDPEKILIMAQSLKNEGVDVTTGIILGLPGDTPESFQKTLDRLGQTQAFSVIQPFTLSVLPGSDFRRDAANLGLRYDTRPPYHLKSSKTFDSLSMRECLSKFEDMFELELDYIGYPCLVDCGDSAATFLSNQSYISKWIVNLPLNKSLSVINRVVEMASNPFIFWFRGQNISHAEEIIERIVSTFVEGNPHTVLTVVFEFVEPVAPEFLSNLLDTSSNPETYTNKAFFPLYQKGEIISPNLLIIAPWNNDGKVRGMMAQEYHKVARIVWSCDLEGISNQEILETPLILSGRIPRDPSNRMRLLEILRKTSDSRPEEILFRHEDSQSWWNEEVRELPQSSLFKESILVT
ncbi:MAG: radical SAM protein [Pseudomonadota bacterium]